jgi:hypothetical protein
MFKGYMCKNNMCKDVEIRAMIGVRVLSSVLRCRARLGGVGVVRSQGGLLPIHFSVHNIEAPNPHSEDGWSS